MERRYLLGNEAVGAGLIAGGLNAAFGYPGTPSSEVMEFLIGNAPADVYVEWSVNEKVACENAYGASLAGGRACAVMKHVGLNVASDAFMTAAYTGVVGGLALVVADDPAIHSSQNEQDSRRYVSFGRVFCLEPSSGQEAYEMARESFALSEQLGLPVVLRLVTRLSHGKSDVRADIPDERRQPCGFVKDQARYVMVPANARQAARRLTGREKLCEEEADRSRFNRFDGKQGSDTVVIASGLAWEYAREYRDISGISVSLLKIGTYPVPAGLLHEALASHKTAVVLEEVDPVVEEIVERVARTANPGIAIMGKLDGTVPRHGELSVEAVGDILSRARGQVAGKKSHPVSLPARPPVLCAGCPHIASFFLLKRAFGKDAVFPGDIGCYTLGVRLGAVDTCLCMGAGISTGTGIARMEPDRQVVSIIGDSTFFHAGIPALINASYNRGNQVIAILDNRTTAMTGHQPHPGTGMTARGEKGKEIDLEQLCRACGADLAVTVNPYAVKETGAVLKKVKEASGVRVVVFRAPCFLLERRRRTAKVSVAGDCKECGVCLSLGCPAIEPREKGSKRPVINDLCVSCGLCVQACPSGALKLGKEGGGQG